jgi:hypothetical protein
VTTEQAVADDQRAPHESLIAADGTPVAGRSPVRWLRSHPVIAVLVLALVVRVVTALVINAVFHGQLFEDDTTYTLLATQKAAGATAGWDAYTHTLYETTWTFTGPLSLLFWLFWPSALIGQLLAAVYGAVAAGLVTATAREAVQTRWAVGAGLLVALLPSQVLFSSLVLKDAAVWAVLAGLALSAAVLGRSTGRGLVVPLVAATVLLALLGHLRLHTLVAASWALMIASLFGVRAWRGRRVALVVLAAVLVPWFMALGPAGLGLVHDNQGTLQTRRQANAVGAATAVVPKPSASPAPTPQADSADAAAANLRYLPQGLEVILLEPLHPTANRRVQLALAENLLWWPLLALAAVGLVTGRKRLRVLAFPTCAAGAIAVLYGLTEGNFGTAYRHRGEIVWGVSILAAVGASQLWARTAARRSGPVDAP